MTHSEKYWLGYVDEDFFDGGDGGAAYGETEPADSLALIPHNYCFNETQTYPVRENDKEPTEAAGQGVSEKRSINKDTTIIPGKKAQYVQNENWLEKVIGIARSGYQEVGLKEKLGTTATGLAVSTQYYFKVNVDGGGVVEYDITTGASDVTYTAVIALIDTAVTAAGITPRLYAGDLRFVSDSTGATSTIALSAGSTGTDLFATLTGWVAFDNASVGKAAQAAGAVPNHSWSEIYYDGEDYKFASGCYIMSYKLILSKTDFPREEIEYTAVNVQDATDANFLTAVVPNKSDTGKVHSDFTVNVQALITDLESMTLTITDEWTEKGATNEFHKYPKLIKRNYELEIATYNYNSTLYKYLETATINLFDPTIACWSKTLTLTEMKLKKDTLNIKDVPEKGLKLYSYTCEIGGTLVPTLA